MGPVQDDAAENDELLGRLMKVRANVEPILQEIADKYKIAISFGYADAEGSFGMAAGPIDGEMKPGGCKYGLGFQRNQWMMDAWPLKGEHGAQWSFSDPEAAARVQIVGHGGLNWGSQCRPCGYNAMYRFGICIAYTSAHVIGLNASMDMHDNLEAGKDANYRLYDAVLKAVGGPRIDLDNEWAPQSFEEGRGVFFDYKFKGAG